LLRSALERTVAAVSTYTTRRDILRRARCTEASRTDRSAALGVAIIRLVALLALLGLLVSAFL
jgi:hypothetical protein